MNVCRVCVVEVEGSRVLVPSCSRKVEPGMVVKTDSERVQPQPEDGARVPGVVGGPLDHAGRGRAGSTSTARRPSGTGRPRRRAGRAARQPAARATTRRRDPDYAATVAQPVKVDNELYVRDYGKCILCYKCVEACGKDYQNTFAITVAGRGLRRADLDRVRGPAARSACVYCGNCIAVCPTGALMFKSEYDHRDAGTWDESRQTVTTTICPYCGVGCNLELHVQDNEIVKVTSPLDHESPAAISASRGGSAGGTCRTVRPTPRATGEGSARAVEPCTRRG